MFDVKTFQTEEDFGHLKVVPVVDEEELKKQEQSLKIKEYDKYTHDNPFQGTLHSFLEGNALENVEDYTEESKDADLKQYLAVESDILVKINVFDQLDPKRKSVSLKRPQAISEAREKLPAALKEFEILESVIGNMLTIVCGETGSGKSTQIPQFLYETGFGKEGIIGITQPRRLAAISLAQRVAEEMGSKLGQLVGYQVRFEASKFTPETRVKFMTDGILLNEMMSDFLLTRYSVVVLDEAHERKINTDLLIGLLSRVIRIRAKKSLQERLSFPSGPPPGGYKFYPLRLIIMSATLRVTDFTENKYLFPEEKINLINVEARMFPVKTVFDRETKGDYVQACLDKTLKIHTQLPAGGILVFLTGEEEIKSFCSGLEVRLQEIRAERDRMFYDIPEEEVTSEAYELRDEEEGQEVVDGTGNSPFGLKDKNSENLGSKRGVDVEDYTIYPLYTKLPLPEQQRIFKHSDPMRRLIVVSTNVAETSLTIPQIKYVVDSGKEKKRVYNAQLTLGRFEIDWISMSSAKQREGRAGRTCPGYCYRVYSQAIYSKFAEFSSPEITKEPLDSSVLTLKTIGIQDVYKFPFVTKPPGAALVQAENELLKIGAIGEDNKITTLGTSLSQLPIKPRLGKLMLMSRKADLLGLGMLLVLALSAEEIFDTRELKEKLASLDLETMTEREVKNKKREILSEHKVRYAGMVNEKSDLLTEANILGTFILHMLKKTANQGSRIDINGLVMAFCREHHLVFKSMRESYSLLLHLLKITEVILSNQNEKTVLQAYFHSFKIVSKSEEVMSVELILAAMIDKVARRIKYLEEGREKEAFETTEHELRVQVHPSSFVFSRRPNYLVYNEVIETSVDKLFLARVTEIDDIGLLAKYDQTKTRKEEVVADPPPTYISARDKMMHFVKGTFGPKLWDLDLYLTDYPGQSREKMAQFLYAILQGKVFPGFKVLKDKLLVQLPEKVTSEPKALATAVSYLLQTSVDSRKTFLLEDKANPQVLRQIILSCVQDKYKKKLLLLWERIVH